MDQRAAHAASIRDPEGFWLDAARAIDWARAPGTARAGVVDQPQWFPDGELSTAFNAVDRHVLAGAGDRPALVYDSAMTGEVRTLTYADLLHETSRLGGALRGAGVGRGDRVLISMPMIPEAVIAMLACARIGAVHCVVFGGFAAAELAMRIDDVESKIVLAASCGLEPRGSVSYKLLVDEALRRSAHRPATCVILQRPQAPAELGERDIAWDDFLAGAPSTDCEVVPAGDPLYVLHTSGTTGRPKGVVREHGGHAVALRWSMANVYGASPADAFWAASDIGWVVGHSYIVYGPLLTGATTVLYEGKPVGTPDAGAFWRVAADHGVSTMFTAPTALRAIKQVDPRGELLARHRPGSLRALFVAGERLDPDTYEWARRLLEVPIVDHWWQTETGWPIAATCLGLGHLSPKPGSPGRPVPGYDVRVLDDDGVELPAGREGHLALELPLPPGAATTLWEDRPLYERSYLRRFAGRFATGDQGLLDQDGCLVVLGRSDDVINVAGHRLSTGAIEAVVAFHPDVAEAVVIGVPDGLKGQVPKALVVLKEGSDGAGERLVDEVKARVRTEVGPIASLADVVTVRQLPKTRSGKVLRGTLRALAGGGQVPVPATIEDPGVLDELRTLLAPADVPSTARPRV